MIHRPLSPDGVHPQIGSCLKLLVICLVRPDMFVVNYCLLFIYFFKELIYFIGFLDKCHTSVFNALIIILSRCSDKLPFIMMGHICLNLDQFINCRFMREVNIKKRGEPPLSFTENGLIEQTELYIYNVKPAPNSKRRRGRVSKAWEEVCIL